MGRVQDIKIDRDIDRYFAQIGQNINQGIAGALLDIVVLLGEDEFIFGSRTQTEVKDFPVADQIITAFQHGRMGEPFTVIGIAQIGMGVKVDDMQIGILLENSRKNSLAIKAELISWLLVLMGS